MAFIDVSYVTAATAALTLGFCIGVSVGSLPARLWPEPGICTWHAATWLPVATAPVRRLLRTDGFRQWAAGPEAAARGRIDRVRRITRQRRFMDALCRIEGQPRAQQCARIGMFGCRVDQVDRPDLHDFSEIHHQDPVRDVLDDVEIVADEHIGQVEMALELPQQVENLRLHRLVQGGHCLIEDQDARLQCQCAGDVDALLLPTGKLVGIALREQFGVQADLGQELAGELLGRTCLHAVDARPVGDGLLDRQPRIERGITVLEDHLHGTPEIFHRQAAKPADRFAVEQDFAAVMRNQVHEQPGQRGLAAARFANHAKRLALEHGEGQAVDCPHMALRAIEQAASDGKVLLEVRDRQHRLGGAATILEIAMLDAAQLPGGRWQRGFGIRHGGLLTPSHPSPGAARR
jgi:hypothetical protein